MVIESLKDCKRKYFRNYSIDSCGQLTFRIGVPDCTLDEFWSFREFKLSLDCPLATDLSVKQRISLVNLRKSVKRTVLRTCWRRHPRPVDVDWLELRNLAGWW